MLDSALGTEDKAMDKKNVPRALLANGKDTTCKILQIEWIAYERENTMLLQHRIGGSNRRKVKVFRNKWHVSGTSKNSGPSQMQSTRTNQVSSIDFIMYTLL